MTMPSLEQSLVATLKQLSAKHPRLAFASSLGLEDMVLTDLIARHGLGINLFTLDTGRLHPETYDLLAQCQERYPTLNFAIITPDRGALAALNAKQSINAFYQSQGARKACCAARKIEPLKLALQDYDAWITGLRREQSEARAVLEFASIDPLSGLDKYNPLLEWSASDVNDYLARYAVPTNALHQMGFPSIGCAPCTRAIQPGEHPRAGRWWWEQSSAQGGSGELGNGAQAAQECGLHVDASGQLVRNRPDPSPIASN
jgi:phosphoadenosine phosphosulfate reductase